MKILFKNYVVSFITAFTFLMFYASIGLATVYYVDYSNGSDSNSGTSILEPLKDSPGDANANANAASIILSGGDKVVFKGGSPYKGTIDLKWSGSSDSNRIVFQGNTDAKDWGIGKAIINNQNDKSYIYGFNAKRKIKYITIKNFEFTEIGAYRVLPAQNGCSAPVRTAKVGAGVYLKADDSEYIDIVDCYFNEIGEWNNSDPFSAKAIGGTGISLQNVQNIKIKNNEFTKMHTGISIKAMGRSISFIEIETNDLHNYLVWGIDIGVRGTNSTISNISINGNKIHDYEEYDAAFWQGCGEKPHTDGIFIRCDYDYATYENINIFNNEFGTIYEKKANNSGRQLDEVVKFRHFSSNEAAYR